MSVQKACSFRTQVFALLRLSIVKLLPMVLTGLIHGEDSKATPRGRVEEGRLADHTQTGTHLEANRELELKSLYGAR